MNFLKNHLNILYRCINVDKRYILTFLVCVYTITTIAQNAETQIANEYYINGDKEKAITLYKKIVKDKSQVQYVHANYLALMIASSQFDEAEKYLNKINKVFPNKLEYQADLLFLFHISGQQNMKDRLETQLSQLYNQNQYQLNLFSQMLSGREMYKEAKDFLLMARLASKNPRAYALEMAALYRLLDEKELMIDEYLNYGLINNRNTNYIKNLFQMLLTDAGDFDQLKNILVDRVQREPDQLSYLDLLIWINLQQKNFYGAFVQAKALDRRTAKPGDESMKVAQIAKNNAAWQDAAEILQYIVDTYPESYHYVRARQQLIDVQKSEVLSVYPVNKARVIQLVAKYQELFDELGHSPNTYQALRDKAYLMAYHLDRKKPAIALLGQVINDFSAPDKIKAECKLLLGDIYLLVNEPWEASLLYGQVQQTNKYDQLGYDARLKNARLYYFTGDFSLANSYLKILKRATTKKIANNAIDLGLLISNNTILDTTDLAMKAFSYIELLNYQSKLDSSLIYIQKFLSNYPNHSLTDEAYFLIANMYMKAGEFESSIAYLDFIQENYDTDILGDDAAYLKAKIIEENLKDLTTAQSLYREFLTQYPGSLYVAEARERFRKLRGDQIN